MPKRRLAKVANLSQDSHVSVSEDLVCRLISALEKQIEANPEAWRGVSERSLQEIATACIQLTSELVNLSDGAVVDPVSGLKLPPEPEILYKDRAAKYGRKIPPEEFIDREIWGRYRDAGLLYGEHIRQADSRLYEALTAKAQYTGVKPAELMATLGILTRLNIDNPPPDLVRQARLIRAARVRTPNGDLPSR